MPCIIHSTEPSVSAFSVIRTGITDFNVSLAFNYLGAPAISTIRIGYRPLGANTDPYKYIDDAAKQFDSLSSLYTTAQFSITDGTLSENRGEFLLEITNSDYKVITTTPVPELIGQ